MRQLHGSDTVGSLDDAPVAALQSIVELWLGAFFAKVENAQQCRDLLGRILGKRVVEDQLSKNQLIAAPDLARHATLEQHRLRLRVNEAQRLEHVDALVVVGQQVKIFVRQLCAHVRHLLLELFAPVHQHILAHKVLVLHQQLPLNKLTQQRVTLLAHLEKVEAPQARPVDLELRDDDSRACACRGNVRANRLHARGQRVQCLAQHALPPRLDRSHRNRHRECRHEQYVG